MDNVEDRKDLVGRSARDGARLFRQWYEGLGAARERGAGAAYVFVMGSTAELLHCFGFETVFPEINSLQTAVRRVAHEYLNEAEEYGYSPDICGYLKADVAMQLRHGEHPMGRIPPPSLAVLTNSCNTYIKWAEIWERLYRIPVFVLDLPGARSQSDRSRPGDPEFERDRRYVEQQMRELVALCEKVTGRKLDVERLREQLAYSNEMSRAYRQILDLNRSVPAPFNALTDGTIYLGMVNAFRGTAEGARFCRELLEEMQYKSAHGIGALPEEQYRLAFVGVPCYPIFRRFYEMFSQWGGAFVTSTYLSFASGGLDLGFEYDLDRPLESLAEGTLLGCRTAMTGMFFQDRLLLDLVDPYRLDGIVFHPIKSCRTISTGLADVRRAILAKRDVGCLFIESDMMDKRVVSEAQMKNRIDAFFEGLAAKRRSGDAERKADPEAALVPGA